MMSRDNNIRRIVTSVNRALSTCEYQKGYVLNEFSLSPSLISDEIIYYLLGLTVRYLLIGKIKDVLPALTCERQVP